MEADLTQGSIAKHLRDLAIPASIGFFFHTMFNVTDTYFAGEISTDALAALSLTFPIFFLIISVAAGMSEALTSLIGNALGEKNTSAAQQILWHALGFALFLSLMLTLIGVLITPYLMRQLGAEGVYLDVSLSYITTLLWGSLFFVMTYFINAVLSAIGDLKAFRNILIVAFFLNIVLNYWFVHGGLTLEAMGIRGIALATVIIEAISMAYLAYRLSKTSLIREMPPFHFDRKIIYEMTRQGIPPTFNLSLMAVGVFVITYFVAQYGKDAVAGMGIGMRVEQIALMPAIGISMSVLSIIARNNGSKAYDRIDETLRVAVNYAFVISLIGMALLYFEAKFFVSLFTENAAVLAEGIGYTKIAAVGLFGYVLIFTYIALLQAIQRPKMLLYIAMARQIILPIIVFSLLAYFQWAITSFWWAIAAITWSAALFVFTYSRAQLIEVKNSD